MKRDGVILRAFQDLLARIYDVPQMYDVAEFLLTDRSRLPALRRFYRLSSGRKLRYIESFA